MFGITATDALLIFRATVAEGVPHKTMSIKGFAEILSKQMLNNTLEGPCSGAASTRRGRGCG